MVFKIKLTYMNISDSDLPMKALNITDSLDGNARFPNLPYAASVLRASVTDYQNILSIAQKDDRAITDKNEKRDLLKQQLHETAAYVIVTAKNDLDTLISSGFDIIIPPPKPALNGLTIKLGPSSGAVTSQVNRASNVRMFWHQITPDPITPESVWTEVMTSNRKYTHTDLTVGARYWIRVKMVTDTDQVIITDPVQKMIL